MFESIIACHQAMEVVVPEDFATLEGALLDVSPGQTVRIRRGLHGARGTTNENAKFGGVQVQVRSEINLVGDPGAELRFGLILRKESGGEVRNLAIVNLHGDALNILGGRWTIGECRVLSRGQAAVTAANQSVVLLRGTVVGGTATRPVASRFDAAWSDNAERGITVGGKAKMLVRASTVIHCRSALCFGNKEGGALSVVNSKVSHVDFLFACSAGKGAGRLRGLSSDNIRIEVWEGRQRASILDAEDCQAEGRRVDVDYYYT